MTKYVTKYARADITFERHHEALRCHLFTRYSFDLPLAEIERVGKCTVHKDYLEIDASEKRVTNKVARLIEEGIRHRLVHQLYQKPTIYITEETGIPLIGSNEYGVVDRGSNIIEVKPVTGCNFTCTYCSVDEGKNKKTYDYLVDAEYLAQVTAEVAATKEHPVEINIGPHGEPLLYPQIVELTRLLTTIPNVAIVSINTNGSLLSEQRIDDLAEAGMTRINLSIPALDPELAARLAGVKRFPLEHLLKMITYAQGKIAILLAPVVIPGENEQEMEGIVELSKSISSDFPTIGIQNYIEYPKGRHPVKHPMSWERFFSFLDGLEQRTKQRLRVAKGDFAIHDEPELKKPFRKGDVVDAEVVMPGRYPNEMVAAAGGRAIVVQMPSDPAMVGKRVRVRIVRDKHNIFRGRKA